MRTVLSRCARWHARGVKDTSCGPRFGIAVAMHSHYGKHGTVDVWIEDGKQWGVSLDDGSKIRFYQGFYENMSAPVANEYCNI